MKKILCITLTALMAVSLAVAQDNGEPGNMGLGYQGIMHDGDIMDQISLRFAPEPVGGQIAVGHMKLDDKDGASFGDVEEWSLTGRVLYNLIDRKQSDLYLSTGLTYNMWEEKSFGGFEGDYWTLYGGVGAEWRFAEIPELGFNFEVGYGYTLFDEEGFDGIFKGTQVTLGAHYYF